MIEKIEDLNIYQKLLEVRKEVIVPKNKKNKFGNYNYRSAEQILAVANEAAAKYGCFILLTDEIQLIGTRYYNVTKAIFTDVAGGQQIFTTAPARESEVKTGMDSSQITGSTMSYARKYALGGLLGIDDGRDADSMDNSTPAQEPKQEAEVTNDGTFISAIEKEVQACQTKEQLKKVWQNHINLHGDKEFVRVVSEKSKQLESNSK